MGDKNNTTQDSAASVDNKKNPTKESASYSQNNPADDHVASNYDAVGYEVNNTQESAWELCGDSAVNDAMGDKNNTTEDSVASNKIYLGRKGHEDKSKIGEDDNHPAYTSPLSILANQHERSGGSSRFLFGATRIRGVD